MKENRRRKTILELTGGENGKGTVFYYAFWAVILFSKSLNLTNQDLLLQLLMLLALGLLALKYVCTDWNFRSCVWGWIFCALGVLTFFASRSSELLLTLLAIIGAKDVKLKPLLCYIFGLRLILFAATILMAVTGIVENVSEFTEDFDGNLLKGRRYYLGFIHPNYAQVALFVLIALYAWIRFEKLNIFHFLVFLILNFVLYRFTLSRTGMLLVCLLCLILALFRRKALFPLGKCFFLLPAFLSLLVIGVGIVYHEGGRLESLNDALSGRLFLIHRFMQFPVTLFGDAAVTDSTYVLDCAYIVLLKQYGCVSFLLFVCGSTVLLASLYRAQNAPALAVASGFLILGFFEHFTVDVFLNASLLCFAPLLLGNRVDPQPRPAPRAAAAVEPSLARNFAYYAGYTVLQVVIPLATIVYVSKILGAEGIGRASFAQTIVSYFTILASLGIPNYGTKMISRAKAGKERNLVFTELFVINAISTSICLVAYVCMIGLLGYFAPLRSLYVLTGVAILLNYCNVDFLYRGTEEYRFMTDTSMAVKAGCLFAMLIFVQDASDVNVYALLSTLALTGSGIFNLIEARRLVRFERKGLRLARHIRPVLVLLAANVAIELYTLLDTTMLGLLRTEAEVGYYTNAMKLVKTTVMVITSIGAVLLPRLSVSFERDGAAAQALVKRALGFLLLLCIPAMFGMYLLSDSIVLSLFGSAYYPSVPVLMLLSPLIVIMGVGNLFGTQVLLSVGAEKKLFCSVALGAVINLCLNAWLIPRFGGSGAALASVIGELAVAATQILLCGKYCRIALSAREVLKLLCASLGMLLVIFALRLWIANPIAELVLSICVGAAVYFGLCALLKQEDVSFALGFVRGGFLRAGRRA